MEGLAEKGFDLEAGQILFYRDPARGLNVHMCKVGDDIAAAYRMPPSAFVRDEAAGSSLLTLIIREAGGLSGQKVLHY